jgi:hypothetical protein
MNHRIHLQARFGVIFAICLAVLLLIAVSLWAIDVPVESTLSDHWQSTEKDYNDKQTREAIERVERGEGSEADQKTAAENLANST